jgi:hypothetical protein
MSDSEISDAEIPSKLFVLIDDAIADLDDHIRILREGRELSNSVTSKYFNCEYCEMIYSNKAVQEILKLLKGDIENNDIDAYDFYRYLKKNYIENGYLKNNYVDSKKLAELIVYLAESTRTD